MRRARPTRSSRSIVAIAPSAAAQATGLPPKVPPRPEACTASISSARPVTPPSGSPPAMPLAVVTRSGTNPSYGLANHSPVRPKPVCTSSATTRIPCAAQNSATRRRKPGAGTTKPPSPWIGSTTTQATCSGPTWVVDQVDEPVVRLVRAPLRTGRPAERVRHRGPVDLRRVRAEGRLVGPVLGGQRHGQQRPAVVTVVESDDARAPRGRPGDLDRVLHRFGAGVDQHRALLVLSRGQPVELLADRHVPLVRGDHEAGVGEPLDLLGDGDDDLGCGVAHAGDRDAGAEVDQRVAVDVEQDPAAGTLDEDSERGADARRDGRRAAGRQLPRARARDLGDQPPSLRQTRTAGGGRRRKGLHPAPPSGKLGEADHTAFDPS